MSPSADDHARPAGPVVTAHVWRVEPRQVPATMLAVAVDRRRLRGTPGLRFVKLLGTSSAFAALRPELTRWVTLTSWSSAAAAAAFEQHPVQRAWRRRAAESWALNLYPLSSRGLWSGQRPFGTPVPSSPPGRVLAITRARLSARRLPAFWHAVPPVVADLGARPGLRLAFGIGEAPLGVQGTFSLWDDDQALREFTHGRAAHRAVVADTPRQGWYAEELFARFAVRGSAGSYAGRDPLGEVTP